MYPRQALKPLLSLLIIGVFCIPVLTVSGEKSVNTKGTETLNVPVKAKSNQAVRHPKRGMSMKQVRKHYGEPKSVRKSKGKVKKLWPRITVWNYGQYSVYFERHIVLHTVVHLSLIHI